MPPGPVAQESHRMAGIGRLGQHEHAGPIAGREDPLGGAQPLVGERRRHPDVDDGDVGWVAADCRPEGLGIGDGCDDLEARLLEDAGQGGPERARRPRL